MPRPRAPATSSSPSRWRCREAHRRRAQGDRGVRGRVTGHRPASTSGCDSDGRRPSSDRAVYVISVAAELAGVHPQTLRIYERKGLVDPARTAAAAAATATTTSSCCGASRSSPEGLNLAGVKRVLDLEAELGRLRRERSTAARERRRGGGRADPPPVPARLVPLHQSVVLFRQRCAGERVNSGPFGPWRR